MIHIFLWSFGNLTLFLLQTVHYIRINGLHQLVSNYYSAEEPLVARAPRRLLNEENQSSVHVTKVAAAQF